MSKTMILSVCTVLLTLGSSLAQERRPYIGIQLDPAPLPELLTKHLGLEGGQGVRIKNVMSGTSADELGLERDDLVVAFQGQTVTSSEAFIDAVRAAGIGNEVSMEVIHLGTAQTVSFRLEQSPTGGQWKYPPEPESVTSWRPGKIFKIGPEGREWVEIPMDRMPEFNFDVESFFKEVYTYHHKLGDEEFAITIEGNPNEKNARVTVRAGTKEYVVTAGDLEELPQKYHQAVREALDNARRTSETRGRFKGTLRLPEPPRPEVYKRFFQSLPRPDMDRWSEQKDRVLEKLEEQMERLQERMMELEQHNREMLERLREHTIGPKEKTDSSERGGPAPSATDSERAV